MRVEIMIPVLVLTGLCISGTDSKIMKYILVKKIFLQCLVGELCVSGVMYWLHTKTQFVSGIFVWVLPYETIVQFVLFKLFVLVFGIEPNYRFFGWFSDMMEEKSIQDKLYGLVAVVMGFPPLLFFVIAVRG